MRFQAALFLTLMVMTLVYPQVLLARSDPSEITSVYEIVDPEAVDGDIIESGSSGMSRAKGGSNSRLFGVLQFNPTLVYKSLDESLKPIARSGQAQINVTTLAGDINPGDYITSSDLPGKGQKAVISGYVVGIALTGLKKTEADSGKITVAVKIEYTELTGSRFASTFWSALTTSFFSNLQDPSRFVAVIRSIGAVMVVLISLILGFLAFSRSIPKAVEAIGRNPLATRSIHISLILNIGLTIATTLVGILAAVIILRL